jgi:myo-inositol 2-dehydrogenase / D-chiro-inositol 1-dehydrogenase
MAGIRARALLASGEAEICGVASRHLATSGKFAWEVHCERYFDDFRRLAELKPDAVLVEVPHHSQDEVVLWALGEGFNVLIGGCLGTSVGVGEKICDLARSKNLVVEAGFEARYSAGWEAAKASIAGGELGEIVAVRSLALWAGDPGTWYYHQAPSGGMPLTHMTYCFINPIRWILGRALQVSAFANRKWQTGPEMITEETCQANVLFENNVPCSLLAGFVKPAEYPAWSVTFFGTRGILDVWPDEQGGGGIVKLSQGSTQETKNLSSSPNAFGVQAQAFVRSLGGKNECRNTPPETLPDIRLAEGIVTAVKECRVVTI